MHMHVVTRAATCTDQHCICGLSLCATTVETWPPTYSCPGHQTLYTKTPFLDMARPLPCFPTIDPMWCDISCVPTAVPCQKTERRIMHCSKCEERWLIDDRLPYEAFLAMTSSTSRTAGADSLLSAAIGDVWSSRTDRQAVKAALKASKVTTASILREPLLVLQWMMCRAAEGEQKLSDEECTQHTKLDTSTHTALKSQIQLRTDAVALQSRRTGRPALEATGDAAEDAFRPSSLRLDAQVPRGIKWWWCFPTVCKQSHALRQTMVCLFSAHVHMHTMSVHFTLTTHAHAHAQ